MQMKSDSERKTADKVSLTMRSTKRIAFCYLGSPNLKVESVDDEAEDERELIPPNDVFFRFTLH